MDTVGVTNQIGFATVQPNRNSIIVQIIAITRRARLLPEVAHNLTYDMHISFDSSFNYFEQMPFSARNAQKYQIENMHYTCVGKR